MSTRHVFALIVIFCFVSQVGCCGMMNPGCGYGGQVYDSGGPSCGLADSCCGDYASCGCPEASCSCPIDASCGCPDGCGVGVGCGAPVMVRCPILQRIRNAFRGCSGYAGPAYWSEWNDSPPCDCDSCDRYGNYNGGPYGSPHGRRAQMAKRQSNFAEELRFSDQDSETIYR